jgi:hypothetical protein
MADKQSKKPSPQAARRLRQKSVEKVALPAPTAAKVSCTFQQFFLVWASIQVPKWDVPDFHFDILDFLSKHANWASNTGVVQIFRGAGKSTIVGLFIVWMLTQDPTLRFLILSADKKTATKITQDVASIIQRHPLARHLHGEEGAWRQDHLVVAGSTDGRNPSLTSWGVMSNITGSRADWIIYDDTEVPKNSQTEAERDALRERLDEATHILVPGGYELFVGTPHSFDSIYPEITGESDKEDPLRSGSSSLKIPALSDVRGEFPEFDGVPTWPQRFPVAELQKRARSSHTKGHFLSQYLLQPYNPDDCVLDPTLVATYTAELDLHTANGATLARINGVRVMSYSCFWDPSSAKLSADDSVLAIIYSTDDGHYYIHRTHKLTGDINDQIVEVMEVMKECDVSHVVIEANGVGEFLPAMFRKAATGRGFTCEAAYANMNKALKIMQAYEVRLSGGFIHAHKSVMDSSFRTQLRDFNHRSVGRSKDDFIDSVASAILREPIRLKAGHYGNRASVWQQNMGSTIEVPMDGLTF